MLNQSTMVRRVINSFQSLAVFVAVFLAFVNTGDLLAQEKPGTPAAGNVLTQAVQILRLSPTEAGRHHPVRFRAVVTFFEQRTQLCFVHDETGGSFVFPKNWTQPVKVGDVVEVTGTSSPGAISAFVSQAELQVVGPGRLPTPKIIGIEQLASGRDDCQWVQLEGIVHRAEENWGHLVLDLVTGTSRLKVRIVERESGQANALIDSKVRVQGVVGSSHDRRNRVDGFHLLVPSMSQLQILEPAPRDPFGGEIRTSREMKAYFPGHTLDHRVRLKGTVTLHWPRKDLFIRDESGGVRVQAEQDPKAELGDIVEATGFPVLEEGAATVADAVFRVVGKGEPRQPTIATLDQISSGAFDHELVKMDAWLVAFEDSASEVQTFALRAEKAGFHAFLPKSSGVVKASRFLPGSRVQITGICSREREYVGPSDGFGLLLRTPQDLALVELPAGSASGKLNWLLWGPPLALVLGFGWVVFLRIRVERQTTALHQREKSLTERQNEKELRRTLEDRERIARDLHDSIIQSIYAAGLNLENCKSLVTEKPAYVQGELMKVRADLNFIIRDVRNFILGLESEALKGQEFKTALKSIVLTLGEAHAPRFSLQIDPLAAEGLTSNQATQLLHIAREAVSNSVRHAQAERTMLSLQPRDGQVRFEVRDNGRGFDPGTVGASQRGLRNMAARARELGAEFSVVSQSGQGTRIVLDIPVKNPHESA